jgi:ParB family chromosome partitioning protein
MAGLIDAGASIDTVAARFGTSERHVRQRLRLGKLAPELLDAYRNGDINLEVVTAFTLGADHQARSPSGISSRTIPTSRPIRCGVY